MPDHTQSEAAIQRLEDAKKDEPELAAYYQFYQNVFCLQAESKTSISRELEMIDEQALVARALQGLPQLAFSQLPIDPEQFNELALEIADALLEYQGQDNEENELSFEDVDWVSLARESFEEGLSKADPEPLELVAHLATAPYLEWASEQIMPHLAEVSWKKGTCPVCGGEPNFAYLEKEEGSRLLICSRCLAEWRYMRMECPFCDNKDTTKLRYYPAGEKKTHRLYVCDACQRYLKAVDMREVKDKVILLAEPVLTWSLDRAAREKGYG